MMTGRATRQSRQRLLNNLTSRSVGRGQGRRQPARLAREPLTAAGAEAIRTLRVNLDTSTLTTCQAKSKLLHMTGVLAAPIRVMQESGSGTALRKRHAQRVQRQLALEPLAERPANYPA